jgi:hypothetical protein
MRHIATKVRTSLDHRTITIVLGTEVEVDDPGHYHQSTTKGQGTEETEDPSLLIRHTITKTMKKRWEHHALLAEFTPRPCPKDSNCPIYDQQKYDGSQEPQSWLSDYLQAVRILGGSKETAMQSFQLHLTGAARSWLGKLERETIGSWDELTK